MAIQWGSWSGSGAGAHRVGIDVSVSGSTLTAAYWVEAAGGVSDNQTLHRSGAFTGSVNYYCNLPFNGGTQRIGTYTRAVSPGQNLTFTASISGIYSGASPSVSFSYRVPASVPGAPVRPSVRSVTASSIELFSSAPSSNGGASIDAYQWNWAQNSNFTGGTAASVTKTSNGLVHTLSNLISDRDYYVRVRARNSAGYGPYSAVRQVRTSVLPPDTPTGLTATRHSDGRFDLSWTLVNPDNSSKPVVNVLVYRHDNITGSYALVATLGKVSAYSDTSTRSDRRYRYAVRARNAGGLSGWAYSDYVVTTPAAPTNVVASRSGADNRIDFTRASSYATNIEVERRAGTGAWTALTSLPPGGGNFAIHTAPDPTTPWTYRARAVSGTVASAWVESNQVVILAPPAKPTGLGPSVVAVPGGELFYRHNSTDGTAQSFRNLRYREVGSSSWVTPVLGPNSNQTIPLTSAIGWLAGHDYEWQVRTLGSHAEWSPWSDTFVTQARSAPTVTVVTPANLTVHANSRLPAQWAYYDAQDSPQSQWELTLTRAGVAVEQHSGSGTRTSFLLNTRLADEGEYALTVRVRSGLGLWSQPAVSQFTVSYPEPAKAIITPDWQPANGLVQLQIANGVGSPVAVSNDIYRAILPVDIVEPGMTVWEGASAPIKPAMVWEAPTAPPAGTLRNGELWHNTSTSDLSQCIDPTSDDPLAVIVSEVPVEGMFVGQYLLNPETLDLAVCVGGNHFLFFDPDDGYVPKIWDVDQDAWVSVGEPPRWQLIAENMPPNSGFPDVTAPVRGLILYRADATSALPSTSEGVTANLILPERESDDAIWLSGGPGFGYIGRLPYDPTTSITAGVVNQPLHRFAGREYPVLFSGDARYKEIVVSGTLIEDSATKNELLELFDIGGTYLYRDASGERMFCSARDLKIDQVPDDNGRLTFSFKVEQIDYEEVLI